MSTQDVTNQPDDLLARGFAAWSEKYSAPSAGPEVAVALQLVETIREMLKENPVIGYRTSEAGFTLLLSDGDVVPLTIDEQASVESGISFPISGPSKPSPIKPSFSQEIT